VTLYDTVDPGPPSVAAESGTLAAIDSQDSPAQQLTVTAVDTDIGPMAFVIYRCPRDFSRPGRDDNAASRAVNVVAESQSGTSGTNMAIWILRPPLFLVHGLWGSRDDWNTFTPLINDPLRQFFVRRADYNIDLAGRVTATTPGYTPAIMHGIRGNALGFDFAAPIVLRNIQQALADFRQEQSAAVTQADVITHSMGGTVARTLVNLQRFVQPETYGAGYIHKLITIGTPHKGSPLARDLTNRKHLPAKFSRGSRPPGNPYCHPSWSERERWRR
jgi:pimeloyl-ACP methyl ester carboxylesterase